MSSARMSLARHIGGRPECRPHLGAEPAGWMSLLRSCALRKPASIIAAQLNYVRGKGDCDPRLTCRTADIGSAAWRCKTENITIDTTDPEKLADWWARALDGQVNPVAPPFFVVVTRPEGPGLAFQKVDDPTPGKNRVHIDFSAADMEAEVKRLVGARRHRDRPRQLRRFQLGGARRPGRQRVLCRTPRLTRRLRGHGTPRY